MDAAGVGVEACSRNQSQGWGITHSGSTARFGSGANISHPTRADNWTEEGIARYNKEKSVAWSFIM